jgi:hypothetical protein
VRVGHTLTADFDDPNLVSTGGLVPVMALAEQAGLHDLAAEHVHISLLDLTEHMGLIETYLLAGAGRHHRDVCQTCLSLLTLIGRLMPRHPRVHAQGLLYHVES